MAKSKDVLTTGEVARICNVAPRTVSKWFDSGQLRGYRIPGSRDRRIPVSQLVRFMEAHGIPLDGLDETHPRVVVVDGDEEFARVLAESLKKESRFEVRTAACAFEAGVVVREQRPHTVLVDVSLAGVTARQVCRVIRGHEELRRTKLIATRSGMTEGQGQALLQDGFHAYLPKPFTIRRLIELIEETRTGED